MFEKRRLESCKKDCRREKSRSEMPVRFEDGVRMRKKEKEAGQAEEKPEVGVVGSREGRRAKRAEGGTARSFANGERDRRMVNSADREPEPEPEPGTGPGTEPQTESRAGRSESAMVGGRSKRRLELLRWISEHSR